MHDTQMDCTRMHHTLMTIITMSAPYIDYYKAANFVTDGHIFSGSGSKSSVADYAPYVWDKFHLLNPGCILMQVS